LVAGVELQRFLLRADEADGAEDELVVGHGCEALGLMARAGEAKGKSRGD
jgi:predicted glycosyltransferase involved in capsule biosynthesis